ncbi:MAG TPA: hypothetical protein P5270_07440 [Victivallales bacterium]|nr:hypothetical protein [Victivallales bacterium]
MRISYNATIGGEIDIPDEEFEGKSDDERDEIIRKWVYETALEELNSSLDWEAVDDE